MTEKSKVLARVISKAWADTQYKQRLIDDPVAVLKEEGVTVPDGVTVAGVPAKIVRGRRQATESDFCAYGTPEDLPDPVAKSIDGMMDVIHRLELRVEELEQQTRELRLIGEAAVREEDSPKAGKKESAA